MSARPQPPLVFALLALLTAPPGDAAGPPMAPLIEDSKELAVETEIADPVIRVRARLHIPAGRDTVWITLTDFEALPRFISNVLESRVARRDEGRVTVIQKGRASFGPMRWEFESEREIDLFPKEGLVSRQVRGNLRRYQGTTRLQGDDRDTWLEFESEAESATLIPPLIGRRFIENQTREQFSEIRAEAIRRAAASTPAIPQR